MGAVDTSTRRLVLVDATTLDDVLELSARLVDRAEEAEGSDALTSSLRGSLAQMRVSVVPEPPVD